MLPYHSFSILLWRKEKHLKLQHSFICAILECCFHRHGYKYTHFLLLFSVAWASKYVRTRACISLTRAFIIISLSVCHSILNLSFLEVKKNFRGIFNRKGITSSKHTQFRRASKEYFDPWFLVSCTLCNVLVVYSWWVHHFHPPAMKRYIWNWQRYQSALAGDDVYGC